MSEIIPSSITDGQKKGFSSPDASWFREESAEFVRGQLFAGKDAYFDTGTLELLVEEHLSGQQNRRLFIWSLLSFKTLMRRESTRPSK
jgi:asparagine synthase (glutamine-hydrolysing)